MGVARVAHPTDHQPQATETTGRKETNVSDELFKADVPDSTNPTEETSISINRKQPVLPTIPQTAVNSAPRIPGTNNARMVPQTRGWACALKVHQHQCSDSS